MKCGEAARRVGGGCGFSGGVRVCFVVVLAVVGEEEAVVLSWFVVEGVVEASVEAGGEEPLGEVHGAAVASDGRRAGEGGRAGTGALGDGWRSALVRLGFKVVRAWDGRVRGGRAAEVRGGWRCGREREGVVELCAKRDYATGTRRGRRRRRRRVRHRVVLVSVVVEPAEVGLFRRRFRAQPRREQRGISTHWAEERGWGRKRGGRRHTTSSSGCYFRKVAPPRSAGGWGPNGRSRSPPDASKTSRPA